MLTCSVDRLSQAKDVDEVLEDLRPTRGRKRHDRNCRVYLSQNMQLFVIWPVWQPRLLEGDNKKYVIHTESRVQVEIHSEPRQ